MANSALFQMLIQKQAWQIIQGVQVQAQTVRKELAEQIGQQEANELIEETVSLLRQLDTASAGSLIQALLVMTACGALKEWVK